MQRPFCPKCKMSFATHGDLDSHNRQIHVAQSGKQPDEMRGADDGGKPSGSGSETVTVDLPTQSTKTQARIADWKRRLIDLTRRNKLLFFSAGRKSTLQITDPSFAEVFTKLVMEGKKIGFSAPESPDEDSSGGGSVSPSDNPEQQDFWKDSRGRMPKELSTSVKDPDLLNSILRNLYRRSTSDFKERGIRTLHVTFGMLEWRDTETSDIVRSPLLLLPCELYRESPNSPYELIPAEVEADVILNPALQVKLWNDFRIELPPVPKDWEEESLQAYFEQVKARIRRQEWELSDESWIGLFSFHKLVIYKDLDVHGELIKKHPIIQRLSKEPSVNDCADGLLCDPRELDNLIKPATSYLVADADSSQLACIEAVKKGTNLVIHGPPGTGKSQTITNLFAECIAAGKSVLFVSEKMAALEVVYKRLRNANLGHYCLELHSQKANKREVVQELYRCYQESLQPKVAITEAEIERLVERQKQLSEYVEAIHRVRPPLNQSAFDVLWEIAGLRLVPFVVARGMAPENLTPSRLNVAVSLAEQLQRVWKVVTEGEDFPWRGCVEASYTPERRSTIETMVKTSQDAQSMLEAESRQFAEFLGLPIPTCLAEIRWLACLGRILRDGPGIELGWLTSTKLTPLISKAQQYLELASRRQKIREELSQHFEERFFDTPRNIEGEMTEAFGDVCKLMGRDVTSDPAFVARGRIILKWAEDLLVRLDDWSHDMNLLADLLETPVESQIDEIPRLAKLAGLCSSDNRPEPGWLDPAGLRKSQRVLADIEHQFKSRLTQRKKILTEYEKSILSLPLDEYVEALSTRYASPIRWLRPGFYRIRAMVRACRRDSRNPPHILKDVRAALKLVQMEHRIEAQSEEARAILGSWYHGYETDISGAEKAMAVAEDILKLVGESPSQKLVIQACQTKRSPQVRQAGIRLEDSLAVWEASVGSVRDWLPLDCIPGVRLPIRQVDISEVRTWVGALAKMLGVAVAHLGAISGSIVPGTSLSPAQIIADLARLAELRGIQSQMLKEAEKLQEEFGSRFIGLDTNWSEVIVSIEWSRKVRDHMGSRTVTEQILKVACKGGTSAPTLEPMGGALQAFEHSLVAVASLFERRRREKISGSDSEESLPIWRWFDNGSFEDYPFAALQRRLQEMFTRLDELRDWIEFKTIEEEFRRGGLAGLFSEFIQRPSLESPRLPDITRRTLLESWISWLFALEPALGRFRAENHESLIKEFRELDSKHCQVGASRVILEAERRKPMNLSQQRGAEAGVLLHEANRRRRHLPIRDLFAQMPNLLTRLKPCLLMSPLSVSQFLDPQQIRFDLVIFDEASQIYSEDAVGSIYRGRQLVVCGDNKQLPPTNFFNESADDDFDEDKEGEMSAGDFDSVLDECMAVRMPQGWLRWHYRSQDESLIAFSSRWFYPDQLVTFPTAFRGDPTRGIEFVCVQDGIYDRGGKRNNIREADAVLKLIERHMYQNPTRSLGVVAFSVPQMEAIQDRVELLLRRRSELQKYFTDDRLEGFFVKNLERVQGDERDVMIFSIGYGKDLSGRLTMNFGPLNKEGGERRLNVAITRARQKNIVVSSIRARDFDLSAIKMPGVLHLYHYLDYAERGAEALELRVPNGSSEPESPLELDIAGAIRELGYEVVCQVGCGKFRIDLGIIDPAEPGRFILGVECDGKMYHSAYTARERDRLRQQVLERLGWRIHRVWSPDWVSRRDVEIRRLSEAIEQARATLKTQVQTPPEDHHVQTPPIIIVSRPPMENFGKPPAWASPYQVCSPTTDPPKDIAFHDPRALTTLTNMLQEVIEVESPVHVDIAALRIARRWNLQKVGNRMTSAMKIAISQLGHKGIAQRMGDFLWRNGPTTCTRVRQPEPDNPDTFRDIKYIPDIELQFAIECLIRDALSIPEEQLLAQVARIFGFDRTGPRIRHRISWNIGKMVNSSRLIRNEGRLSIAR